MPARFSVFPQCPQGGPTRQWADQLIAQLTLVTNSLPALPIGLGLAIPSDVTPPASFDPATATLPEVAMMVATLLVAMKNAGIAR